VPITNWHWSQVKATKSKNGTLWGVYRVVGTYDGRAFTLTERPGPPDPAEPSPLYPDEPVITPCSPPGRQPFDAQANERLKAVAVMALTRQAALAGQALSAGKWPPALDPELVASEQRTAAVTALARQAPGYAGLWMVNGGTIDQVLNVAFTGDVDRREAELREIWAGALCVVRYERTYHELRSIQDEFAAPRPFGLQLIAVGIDEARNHVDVRTLIVDDGTRRAIDALYGVGAVRFFTALNRQS